MDFKVAGTDVGITSLQMDIKSSITSKIMKVALDQSDGRNIFLRDEKSNIKTKDNPG